MDNPVYEVTKDESQGIYTSKVMERSYPSIVETMEEHGMNHLSLSNRSETIQVRKAPRSKYKSEVIVGVNSPEEDKPSVN